MTDSGLGGCEDDRLLLWALRRCAFGCGDLRVVEAALCDRCGREAGRLAYVGLRSFLTTLALYGRRPLRLGPPGYGGATADERGVIGLFAAAQAKAEHETEARLAWLMRPTSAADAMRIVDATGTALAAGGIMLPRAASGVPDRQRPGGAQSVRAGGEPSTRAGPHPR